MKLLTIIPTQEELDCFLHACSELGYKSDTMEVGKLSINHFPTIDVAVASGGLGKTQFAVQTQYLIDTGRWELVICAGAAGALVDDLAVGDVVIATESVEHDIQNRFGKPMLPKFPCDESVLGQCRQTLRSDSAFFLHYGPIASGDEDVVDSARRAAIHAQTKALVVAWEGAGGARSSQYSKAPFLEIRGVTDSAGSNAASNYRTNLKTVMSNVAIVISRLARCCHNQERG
jgi:adenosylhomocysteine nucleosidase